MMQYLDIEQEEIKNDFVEMAFMSVHVEKCHIEDLMTFENELDELNKKVRNHYVKAFGTKGRVPFRHVLVNTFRRIWGSSSDFTNSYHMWSATKHHIKL